MATLFFCTNTGNSGKHANCINRLVAELYTARVSDSITIVPTLTTNNSVILDQLQAINNDITVFHFDGHANDLDELQTASETHGPGPLLEYLAGCPNLQLVVLNYCARPGYVERLQALGIRGILATSHNLPYGKVRDFASQFYQYLLIDGDTAEDAYIQTIAALEIQASKRPRYYADYHGDGTLQREWIFLSPSDTPTVIGNADDQSSAVPQPGAQPQTPPANQSSSISPHSSLQPSDAGSPPLSPPPPSDAGSPPSPSTLPQRDPNLMLPSAPFPGPRPYSPEEALIFLGRDAEIGTLFDTLVRNSESSRILLTGQAGVGKSSFLQAGLIPYLQAAAYQVVYLNGRATPNLFAALCRRIGASPTAELSTHFWTSATQFVGNDTIVIVDQLEPQLSANREAFEFARFCAALRTFPAAGTGKHRLLLTLRLEEQSKLLPQLRSGNAAKSFVEHHLEALNADHLRQIFDAFAAPPLSTEYQFKFSQELKQLLIADLTDDPGSSIAPLLQATLADFWQQWSDRTLSPLEYYRGLRNRRALYHTFFTQQLNALELNAPHKTISGEAQAILTYHIPLMGSGSGRRRDELKKVFPAQRNSTEQLVDQLKEYYLLTEMISGNNMLTRLSHRRLEAPILQAYFPQGQYMRWWRLLWARRHLWLLRIRQWTTRGYQFCRTWGTRGWRWLSSLRLWHSWLLRLGLASAALILIAVLLLRIALTTSTRQADMTPFVGDLQFPSLFLLNRQQVEEPLAERFTEWFTGESPLRTREISFQRIGLLHQRGALYEETGYDPLQRLFFSQDRRYLMAGGDDSTVDWWQLSDLQALASYQTKASPVVDLALDGANHSFAYTDREGTVWLRSLETGAEQAIAHHGPGDAQVRFSPDGNLVISGGADGIIAIYGTSTEHFAPEPPSAITALAVAPVGRYVAYATAEDNIIHIWDSVAKITVANLQGHQARVRSLEFRADAPYLLSTSHDYTVRLWPIVDHAEGYILDQQTDQLPHANFLPNRPFVVTTSDPGNLQLWQADDRLLLDTVPVYGNGISALTVSSDGQTLAVAGWDGSIALWQVETLFSPLLP
ncbi:MAG: AAA family ATPase [Caldilineaceae bacterium]